MLPIVPTRASSSLEVMEPAGIPHNNFPLSNYRYKFCYSVAITTDPQVLEDPDRSFRRGANNSIGNSQPLTMAHEDVLLLILFNILQHKAKIWNITNGLYFRSQIPQLPVYLLTFWMSLVASVEDVDLVVQYD